MISHDAIDLLERLAHSARGGIVQVGRDDFREAVELSLRNPADCHHLNRWLGSAGSATVPVALDGVSPASPAPAVNIIPLLLPQTATARRSIETPLQTKAA